MRALGDLSPSMPNVVVRSMPRYPMPTVVASEVREKPSDMSITWSLLGAPGVRIGYGRDHTARGKGF